MAPRTPPHTPAAPQESPWSTNFDFIGKRNIAFAISGASVVIFWIWVFATGGLRYGIDFTGGIQHIFKFNRASTPDLLSDVREAALAVDPSALVKNIGKPEEGGVLIQVKGFDLVENAAAKIRQAPLTGVEDIRTRLAGFDIFDTPFFEGFRRDTTTPSPERVIRAISDYVNEATGQRLISGLERRFGQESGRIDLNKMPSASRLFTPLQQAAIRRIADRILAQMTEARAMEDFRPLFKSADLDPAPFFDKYQLRPPTLEEIKTDLHEFSGRPADLAAVLLKLYPDAFREDFVPSLERIISNKETRGLNQSMDEAVRLVDGPQAALLTDLISGNFYTGPFVLVKTDQVSSRIGAELRQKAFQVISLSLLVMLIYIWFRFEFRYGIGAIVTLLHDSLTIIPLMSVLGYEYDINLIAAILTLIGYSLNDTIVVYDRIRENFAGMRGADPKTIINTSVVQTLSRTVVTGITTLLAVLSLYFFGGPVLEGFSLALFIGILVGTYSSIFVSSPVVYLWPSK